MGNTHNYMDDLVPVELDEVDGTVQFVKRKAWDDFGDEFGKLRVKFDNDKTSRIAFLVTQTKTKNGEVDLVDEVSVHYIDGIGSFHCLGKGNCPACAQGNYPSNKRILWLYQYDTDANGNIPAGAAVTGEIKYWAVKSSTYKKPGLYQQILDAKTQAELTSLGLRDFKVKATAKSFPNASGKTITYQEFRVDVAPGEKPPLWMSDEKFAQSVVKLYKETVISPAKMFQSIAAEELQTRLGKETGIVSVGGTDGYKYPEATTPEATKKKATALLDALKLNGEEDE